MEGSGSLALHTNMFALVAFLGYLILLLIIGIVSMKFSSKGIGEFFLGGRKMNRFVVALSAVVSGRSSWLLIGVTGMAYLRGASAVWAVVGYTIVEFLLFVFVAPRLRRETEQLDALTIPDYLSTKYDGKNQSIRWVSTLIIVLFMTAYISAQFLGGGKTFAASFHISPQSGIYVTAGVVLLYTVLGGFLAVSITDVVQAFFMIFGLVILPILVGIKEGNFFFFVDILKEISPKHIDPLAISAGGLIGFLGIGLGSPGNPHILVRYMSIEKEEQLKTSALVGTFWNVVMGWSAVFIGLMGKALYPNIMALPGGDKESIFPYLAQNYLHPILFGIVIASIFAAIMSTADSMLLVVSSSIIRDIYQKIFHPEEEIPEKSMVFYSRVIIILVILLAILLGFVASKVVFWLVLFAWGGLGAAFGPPVILSLFYPYTTRRGILSGMIIGTISIVVWNQIPWLKNMVYELVPAFLLSFVITFLVSKWEYEKTKEV